jgi:hypothetical protein
MLRMYVMDKPSIWEDYLHLAEFLENNGYQASLEMSPFERLYCRKCNTPVIWDNPLDKEVVGPEILREFKVGDHVFLNVKDKRISLKF